jgi:arylsulfatase A-like enzyme
MGHMLASAGYNVVYKGKWHMSRGDGGGNPSIGQVAGYGFNNWEPPDAGEATNIEGFGGGCSDNDGRFMTQAVNFLGTQTPAGTATTPFALIVSLVNPHDVLAYPKTWDADTCSGKGYADQGSSMFTQGINISDTASYSAEDLTKKPTCQKESLTLLAAALGIMNSPPSLEPRNYVNFYAYLQKVVDDRIRQVLEALDTNGLTSSTVIFRFSDHGEMGLAHGGLRQKIFNAYQETMHIPLVISHPSLSKLTTDCFASLVDLMPTLATLCGVPNRERFTFAGTDLSSLLSNPNAEPQSAILFTFDDQNAGVNFDQTTVKQPNHIRCIRLKDSEGEWMYARYFDPSGQQPEQYEMYQLKNAGGVDVDPNELTNLARDSAWDTKRGIPAQALAALEKEKLAPYGSYLPVIRK